MTPLSNLSANRANDPARTNRILYVAVVLLACAAMLGGFFAWQAWDERDANAAVLSEPDKADVPRETYGDVLAAAKEAATAFTNIDYRELGAATKKMRSLSTGDFKKQYAASTDGLRTVLRRNKSIMEGEVTGAGVVAITEFTARVLVATQGTVQNKTSENKPIARNLRLQLDLIKVDGTWLTSDLQFVG